MKTHEDIDQRSLQLARAVVNKVEDDPEQDWVERARATCRRWMSRESLPVLGEWMRILDGPWSRAREVLLDESQEGRRLRQSNPFCGVLSPQERWQVYRRVVQDATKRS